MTRAFTKTLRSLLTVPACVVAVAACSAPEHSEIFGAPRASGENLGTGGGVSASGGANSVTGSGGAANSGGKVPTGGRNAGQGKTGGAPGVASGGAPSVVDPVPGDTGGTGGGLSDSTGGTANASGGAVGGCVPTAEVCDGLDNNCENGIADEVCPPECKGVAIAGRGYMFCPTLERTWSEVEAFCTGHGMSMLKLETANENTAVSEVAAQGPNGGIEWVWIGASDVAMEGSWLWTGGEHFWVGEANGMPVDGRFSAWVEGQPNNNGDEDCARVYPSAANWSDGDCNVTAPALICETE